MRREGGIAKSPKYATDQSSVCLRIFTAGEVGVIMRSVASVCLSVCPVRALTFESFNIASNVIFGMQAHLHNNWVRFMRQGHFYSIPSIRIKQQLTTRNDLHWNSKMNVKQKQKAIK